MKIGDAALSSDIHSCDYEVAENWAVQIPARWMAPESLTAAEFTLRSNVVKVFWFIIEIVLNHLFLL